MFRAFRPFFGFGGRKTPVRKQSGIFKKNSLAFETLEDRTVLTTLALGDIAFTGYQATSPDKAAFVLLKDIASGTVLTVTDNAWSGTALGSSEGNSVITFGGAFSAGTQFNYDASRTTGLKWAVGSATTNLSDTTGSNFALNASGDNLFAYNGATAPTTGGSALWVSALASNAFLTSGSSTASLTYLPSALTLGDTAFSLGLANAAGNENGTETTPATVSGTPTDIRSTVYTLGNWTTFTAAGAQAIPPATTFTINSGNTAPIVTNNTGITLRSGATATISNTQLQATDAQQAASSLTYTVTTAPANGVVKRSGTALGVGGTFTQADIDSNLITYVHGGGANASDSFAFTVTDGAGGSVAGSFNFIITPNVLLNELKVNPPGNTTAGDLYQYIELRGTPGAALTNISLVMFDGSGSVGVADYAINLTGQSFGSSGLLMIKNSPTDGHTAPAGTTVVTDSQFALNKHAVSFYVAYSTAAFVIGTDYDAGDDGSLDANLLPAGFLALDNVGWQDDAAGGVVYGGVVLTQNQGTPDAASRFDSDSSTSAAAWYNGDLFDTGNVPSQLLYDATRSSANLPTAPNVAMLTPGAVNFSEPPTIAINLGLSVTAGTSANAIADTKLKATDTEQSAAQLTFTISSLPFLGTLKFNGAAVVANATTFTQADISANNLTYDAPAAAGSTTFSFSVSDGYASTSGTFAISVNAVVTNSTLRIADYNIASSGGDGSPRTGLDTLLQAFGAEVVGGISRPVDLFVFQEVQSQATTSATIAGQLNAIYGSNTYAHGSLDGFTSGAGTQGVVYNTQTLQLLAEATVGPSGTASRQTMRYLFEPIGGSTASQFYVYDSHLKASTGTTNEDQRATEVTAIRADADSLGQGKNIIYAGDFNLYTSAETAYQDFLAAGNGQALDPLNRPGNWHNNSSFLNILTQAPAVAPPGGLTSGGLDDRFDFQLMSGELTDGSGLEYIPSSYHTFGNNGSVALNGNINDPSSTALSGLSNRTTVLDYLTTVTDHLPVVADYTFASTNSAPTIAVNTGLTVTIGTTANLIADTRLKATDTQQSAAQLTFTVTALPNVGTLKFNNVAVIANSTTFTQADITLNKLTYDAPTTAGSASFSFTVSDGTLSTSGTFAITVSSASNSAPTIATNTGLIVTSGTAANVIADTVLKVTDAEQSAAQLTFTVTTLPASGTLKFNGVAVVANSTTFTQADITANNLTYDAPATAGSASFAFSVSDGTLSTTGTFAIAINTAFGLGDIAFTGYQSSTTDKLSFVLLKSVGAGTVLTFDDNAWTGSALATNEGTSILTFGGTFGAGTQINYDASRGTGAKWAVGTDATNLSDVTSGFALNSVGDNVFAYSGSTAPTSGADSSWVAAFATNPFLTTGTVSSSLTYLPAAFTVGSNAFTLGIANGAANENAALTGPASTISGTPAQIRAIIDTVANWTTYSAAGAQAIPPAITFSFGTAPTPTVTVTSSDVVYSGTAYVPSSTVSGPSGVDATASVTYTFYVGATATGTPLAVAPTAAGTYSVVASFAGDSVYTAGTSVATTFHITPVALTATAMGGNKTYDGGTVDSLTISLAGVLSGDTVTATGTGAFADKNVGTAKTVSVSGIALAGASAGNYTVNATASTTADIMAKSLTATATGSTKTYDGTTADSVTIALAGVVGGDTVSATGTGAFANKNVGTAKPVSVSGITLAGVDAGNYTVNTTASTTADITAVALTATATGSNRTYDGTMVDSVTIALAGVLSGDTVSVTGTGAFANKNIGTAKPVSVSGIALAGADAGNYTVNATASTAADITAVALTATATGSNKTFDGTTTDSVTISLAGVVSGDVVTASGTGAFADPNIGTAKPVSVTGITLAGTDAGNYTVNGTATTSADITPVNDTPVFANATPTLSLYFKSAAGTVVLTTTATDVDAGQMLTYSIVSVTATAGVTMGVFGISNLAGRAGEITVLDANKLKALTGPVTLVVRATDNGTPVAHADATVTINLKTADTAAAIGVKDGTGADAAVSGGKAAVTVDEAATGSATHGRVGGVAFTGTLVATLSVTDVDEAAGTFVVAMDADKTGGFEFDSATGKVYVKDASVLDFEKTPLFKLKFAVPDHGLPGKPAALTTKLELDVSLADKNDGPTIAFKTKNSLPVNVGEAVLDTKTVKPFAGVTIFDEDHQKMGTPDVLTVTIALDDAAKGSFTSASLLATGFVAGGTPGTYVFTGASKAATAAIAKLVFAPTPNRVAVDATETTTFTLTVTDSIAANVIDGTTTVVSKSVNNVPTFTGLALDLTGQTVDDKHTIHPFTNLSISDVDVIETVGTSSGTGQQLAVIVALDKAAQGTFTAASLLASGFVAGSTAGTYTYTGTASQATTALGLLVFQPTENDVAFGKFETTKFTVTVADPTQVLAAKVTKNKLATVIVAGVNDDATIAGVVSASQAITDKMTATPFTGVTIADVDPKTKVTATITLDVAANGTLVSSAFKPAKDSGGVIIPGVYTYKGTPAAVTTALQGVVFKPTANQVAPGLTTTTHFALSVTDGVSLLPTTSAGPTVVTTSVNDAPTIGGTKAGAKVKDNATVLPFAKVTIGDVDVQNVTVTVSLSAAVQGSFTAQSLTDSGFIAGTVAGTYTFNGTAAAAQVAIRKLAFQSRDLAHNVSETTGLTISVDDGIAAATVDAVTTVIATGA